MNHSRKSVATFLSLLLLICIISAVAAAQSKSKKNQYACAEANPESLCNVQNTCGSESEPCVVEIKRTADSVKVQASIAEPKSKVFCLKPGTKVTFKTTSKNTGFLVDFGPDAPFDQTDAISGGSSRETTVIAQKSGCYNFSVGACVSGAISGMCRSVQREAVVMSK